MTTAASSAPRTGGVAEPDAVCSRLVEMLGWLGGLVEHPQTTDDATRIDRIAALERLKGAIEAVQAVESVSFARSQVAEQRHLGVPPDQQQRGIADQLALACGVSPSEGSRRLTFARDLVLDMPTTLTSLARGDIGPWPAALIVREVSHLDRATRHAVDTQLATSRLAEKSPRQCALTARRLAQTADPAAAVERARHARNDRQVTLRPAPDTMSFLTALLPVEQGVACLAALRHRTDQLQAAGDPRGRGQIMTDTLVERITGQATATAIDAEIQLVMPLAVLTAPDDPTPVELPGHGTLPAPLAREILTHTGRDIYWRRLITEPDHDRHPVVIGIDRQRRRFSTAMTALIDARDGRR